MGYDINVQLLQPMLLSFSFKHKENCEKGQGIKCPGNVSRKGEEGGIQLKSGLCPPNVGSTGKM